MNAHSQARLALLEPGLAAKVEQLAQMLEPWDIRIEVTQGLRTFAEQDALYAQGREPLDLVNARRAAANMPALIEEENDVVTNAKAGESWHNFALAADVVPYVGGEPYPDWDASHPDWQRITALAPSCGLKDGVSWKDEPHLQPAELPDSPTDEDRTALARGGVSGAWAFRFGTAQEAVDA